MSSSKIDYGRRARMLRLAAEAPEILASESDRLENSFWPSKTVFLQDYPAFSDDGQPWKDDDQNIDLMALVVVDDFPVETLNDVLRANTEETSEPFLWLADTYDSLPDWSPSQPAQGTSGTVDKSWRSPFINSSIEDIVAFIEAAPKPSKPLCKRFFAVLDKKRYEQDQRLLIYKTPEGPSSSEGESRLQCVPCPAHYAGLFFASYNRSDWHTAVDDQALCYGEGAAWEDDDPYTQVMALFVLDDLPTETINKVLDDNTDEADEAYLWLADMLGRLPDYRPSCRISGTSTPIGEEWKSPFVGKTIADAANFIRNAPKPPKPLCKRFFAVLQKDRFEKSGQLLICKILPDESEEEVDEAEAFGNEAFRKAGRSLICKAGNDEGEVDEASEFEVQMAEWDINQAGTFFSVFERHSWLELGFGKDDWVA